MKFIEKISETKCYLKQYIDNYYGQPLIVLGAGVGAVGIISYLLEKGITEFHVCVDDVYWQDGQRVQGYVVESISQVLSEASKPYDIIVAFSTFDKRSLEPYKMKYPDSINNVEFYDIISHFWVEPQIYSVDRKFYESNDSLLTKIYDNLADELSRKVLVSFVEQRISGEFSYSDGVLSPIDERYYDTSLFNMHHNAVLIDCGAYDGEDTKEFFARFAGDTFSFVVEPDKENVKKISENLADYSNRTLIINSAVCDKKGMVSFSDGGGEGSGINENGSTKVSALTIDDLYKEYPDKFDNRDILIKMDIEGTELKALYGAKKVIEKFTPILSICLYHKPEDIIDIPIYLMNLQLGYKFYMRRYDKGFRELILYAIPNKDGE